jgi:hypothetical protein
MDCGVAVFGQLEHFRTNGATDAVTGATVFVD